MADKTESNKLTLEELMVSNLAMTEATVKLLIDKGVFTDAEFKAQLSTERANYLAVLKHSKSKKARALPLTGALMDIIERPRQAGLAPHSLREILPTQGVKTITSFLR